MTCPPVTPDIVFERRSGFPCPRGWPPDLLDYTLFLPSIWLVCGLAIALRLIGPLFVVIPVGFCLLYAVLRLTVPPRLLSAYVAFCIFVAILSKYELLPTSWQTYFREDAIVRQLIPTLAYFAVAWGSKAYFRRRLLAGDPFFGTPLILALSLIIGPAVMYQQGLQYQGEDSAHAVIALYGAFINNTVIALFFITGGIFLANDWRRYAGIVVILAIAVTTHFIQFQIMTIILLAVFFGVSGRAAVIFAMVALPAIYAIAISHIPEVMLVNPNSGIRLAFTADAITSAIDTHGIGVGFGKESVRWRYEFANMPVFTFLPDPRTMTSDRMLEVLSTGVENSFVEPLLRTGVLGFGLFLAAFCASFPSVRLPRQVRNHAAIVFAISFIGCFVNSALESPNSVVGQAFVYGYLCALRACSRSCPLASLSQSDPMGGRAALAGGQARAVQNITI